MDYLQNINNVPSTYNIGKLSFEDPISVFKAVLIKGSFLGEIDHFYWKKEHVKFI